jgi:lysophospholipase L1-like esterase
MRIPQHTKLVMIGDSITDCNRARPVGEGVGDALGNGYVSMINALIASTDPTSDIRVVNMGVSGNTVRDLKARWQTDALDLSPQWLSVMIGINDIARHYNRRQIREFHVSVEEYERTLDELIASAVEGGVQGLVLMAPFFIENNSDDTIRRMTAEYGAAMRRVADRYGAIFVDVQAAFDRYLEHHYSMEIALDRIHPTPIGHMIIARAWLDAVGYRWNP